MHYRSFADMSRTLQAKAGKLPADIDLVVGIPRSGLFPASMISLLRNIPLADLDGFIDGRILSAGRTRRNANLDWDIGDFKKVLVVDDSVFSGGSMEEARRKISSKPSAANILFCAIYSDTETHPSADIVLESVPTPRMFQWNVFHHSLLARSCIDLDELILPPRNTSTLVSTPALDAWTPICVPTKRVQHLVTSYSSTERAEVEAYLDRLKIQYDQLWMQDAQEDSNQHKARVYRDIDAIVLLTSHDEAAAEIARQAHGPVLSLESQFIVRPTEASRFLEEVGFREARYRARGSAEKRHRRTRRMRHILRRLRVLK
jgi:hypoxanthine phosphoribosyltransferase